MNDDARNIATPLDAYVAVGRRLGFDPNLIILIRRKGVWDHLTANEAAGMVHDLITAFGHDATAQLISDHPADYRESVKNVEPRMSRILSMCPGLSRRDVHGMMQRAPKIFTVDTETFSALQEAIVKLLPNASRRWTFLYAYPGYFGLNPVLVGEAVARGVSETAHGGDHVALWIAINSETEQKAWLELTNLFRTLKYRDILRARYLERLYRDLGSYNAGLRFVSDLLEAGWLSEDVRDALGAYATFRRAGSARIVALQTLLVSTFGIQRYLVVATFMKRPILLSAPLDLVVERISAALPDPTPDLVERLLRYAPAVLLQPADVTVARRLQLDATPGSPDQHLAHLAERRVMPDPETSAPSETKEKRPVTNPERFEDTMLSRMLGELGVSRYVRGEFTARLLVEFGSADAVAAFLDRLRDAGWDQEARHQIVTKPMWHKTNGADVLIALQTRLSLEFNLTPYTAAMIVASHPNLTTHTPDELCERIRAALPSPTPENVERLMNGPPRILELSTEELLRRRHNLLAHGIDPGESPQKFVRKVAWDPPPPPPEPEPEPEPEPPPPPPPPRPLFATTLEAIEAAGWSREDALLHQDTFYDIQKLDPLQVHRALSAIKRGLGLSGRAFTTTLLTNVIGMIRRRDELLAAYRDKRELRSQLDDDPFTHEQATDACRIAVGVHALAMKDPGEDDTVRETRMLLRRFAYHGRTSTALLIQHPELLTDDARPLSVLQWLVTGCRMGPARVKPNMKDADCRLALFVAPDTLLATINAHRLLATEYEELGIDPTVLDPCVRWSRIFIPPEEFAFRLEFLLHLGWKRHRSQRGIMDKKSLAESKFQAAFLQSLHVPSRSAFLRAAEKQMQTF